LKQVLAVSDQTIKAIMGEYSALTAGNNDHA